MENFYCLNCLFVAPLTVHGRCQICGSEAVMPNHVDMNPERDVEPDKEVTLFEGKTWRIALAY